MLVPGALGLQGVSMLLGPLGSNAASTLVTTLISMIGVSLGILVGLAFIGRDPDQAWFGDMRSADDSPAELGAFALRGCSRGVRILIVASLALVFVEVLTAAGSGHHGSPVGPNGSAAEWSYRQPDDQEDQPDGSAPTTSERQEPTTDGASRGEDTPAGAPQVEGTPDTDPPTRDAGE